MKATFNAGILLLFACAILSGCASIKLPELTTARSETYRSSQTKDGLSIAVDPLTDKQKLKEWFRKDIVAEGLLPMLVVVDNRNPSTSFAITKERILLRSAASTESFTSKRTSITDESSGKAVLAAGAVALSPILIGIGGTLQGHEQITQFNLADKELANQTVSPSGHLNGFVYYAFSKGTEVPRSYVVTVEAIELGTNRSLTFEFKINLDQTSP